MHRPDQDFGEVIDCFRIYIITDLHPKEIELSSESPFVHFSYASEIKRH